MVYSYPIKGLKIRYRAQPHYEQSEIKVLYKTPDAIHMQMNVEDLGTKREVWDALGIYSHSLEDHELGTSGTHELVSKVPYCTPCLLRTQVGAQTETTSGKGWESYIRIKQMDTVVSIWGNHMSLHTGGAAPLPGPRWRWTWWLWILCLSQESTPGCFSIISHLNHKENSFRESLRPGQGGGEWKHILTIEMSYFFLKQVVSKCDS